MNPQEQLRLRVQVGNIFRPGAPIDKANLFAGRSEQVKDVINATVQPGRHIILFGERGVGKTSLAKVLSEILSIAGLKVLDSGTINCDITDTFTTLWHKIMRQLSVVLEKAQTGFTGDQGTIKEKICLEGLLPDDAKPDDIRHILSRVEGSTIIIIDEVDRIQDTRSKALLADTIKTLSDHSVNTTLLLVGVADSVSGLISEHESIERALVQVPMPRMSRPELLQIINNGLTAVGMSIDAEAREWIVKLSQGLPHYTHLIALYSAFKTIDSGRTQITIMDVRTATKVIVEKAHTILGQYNKATSSPQKQNLYAKVLLACALVTPDDLGYFPAAQVSKPMTEIMGKKYYVPNFSRHLFDFCHERRGPILEQTGDKRRIRFRFKDPLMQPFLIIHGYSTGHLTNELIEKSRMQETKEPEPQSEQ